MAKEFIVTNIVDPVKAPITERSLRHINSMTKESASEILKGLVKSYATNDLLIISGCVVTASIPGTSSVTAGCIYYNGEFYQVDANASISSPSNTLVWSIVTTYASGDPATFSDGNSYNFHAVNKMQLTNAATGTGIADYNGATVKNKSYTYSTGSGGDYIALDNRTVHVNLAYGSGNKTNTQTLYTIPAAFRTTSARTIGVALVTYQAGAGSAQEGHCINATLNTNTGVLAASMDMAASHDVIVGGFSYLLD